MQLSVHFHWRETSRVSCHIRWKIFNSHRYVVPGTRFSQEIATSLHHHWILLYCRFFTLYNQLTLDQLFSPDLRRTAHLVTPTSRYHSGIFGSFPQVKSHCTGVCMAFFVNTFFTNFRLSMAGRSWFTHHHVLEATGYSIRQRLFVNKWSLTELSRVLEVLLGEFAGDVVK